MSKMVFNCPSSDVYGELYNEVEIMPDKKEEAIRTELQQDSRVNSPLFSLSHVREIGKIDE